MLRVIATATRNLKAKKDVWNWLKVHIEFVRKPYLGTGDKCKAVRYLPKL
jgi:hypothetical protein